MDNDKLQELIDSEFACACKDGKADMDQLYDEVLQEFKDNGYPQVTERNFCTLLVVHMHWEMDVYIKGIPWDQWGAIDSEWFDYKDGSTRQHLRVQCDYVEHGLVLTYKIWQKKLADKAASDTTAEEA